jgi:anti-sigma factor RsiW
MKKMSDEQWTAYFDGQLPESERKEAERLLAEDAEGARDLEAWREIRSGLQSLSDPAVRSADEVWKGLRDALPEQKAALPMLTHPGWIATLGSAAAAAVVALWGWTPGTGAVPASVEYVDSRLPESVPVVYTDGDSGWTVVWLSDANLGEPDDIL